MGFLLHNMLRSWLFGNWEIDDIGMRWRWNNWKLHLGASSSEVIGATVNHAIIIIIREGAGKTNCATVPRGKNRHKSCTRPAIYLLATKLPSPCSWLPTYYRLFKEVLYTSHSRNEISWTIDFQQKNAQYTHKKSFYVRHSRSILVGKWVLIYTERLTVNCRLTCAAAKQVE